MAPLTVLTIAGSAGFIAADVTPTPTNGGTTSTSIIVGGIVAVVVALIGGGIQLYASRRRANDPNSELTLPARMAVMETNQAEMKRTLDDVVNHLRPWGSPDAPEERRRR